MALLEVKNVKKIYTTRFGGNQVQALSDVNFFGGAERVRGNHGRIRFWENNSFEHSGCVG